MHHTRSSLKLTNGPCHSLSFLLVQKHPCHKELITCHPLPFLLLNWTSNIGLVCSFVVFFSLSLVCVCMIYKNLIIIAVYDTSYQSSTIYISFVLWSHYIICPICFRSLHSTSIDQILFYNLHWIFIMKAVFGDILGMS